MQKTVASAYEQIGGVKLPPGTLVKARTKDGSNWLDIDFTEVVKTAITHMTSAGITTVLCFAIFCAISAYVYKTHEDAATERNRAAYMESANAAIREVALAAVEQSNTPVRPMNRELGRLRKDSVEGKGRVLPGMDD